MNSDTEYAYGVIPMAKHNGEDVVLLIRHVDGSWGFPKGRKDEGEEGGVNTALRELQEETGITKCDIDEGIIFKEHYHKPLNGAFTDKIITYYLGSVHKVDITMQPAEIDEYRWATLHEALQTLTYESRKRIAREAFQLITNITHL